MLQNAKKRGGRKPWTKNLINDQINIFDHFVVGAAAAFLSPNFRVMIYFLGDPALYTLD